MSSDFPILRRSFLAVLGGVLVLTASVAAEPKPDLTGQQILERTAEVYASCTSYSDSGMVKTLFITPRGDRMDVQPFSTAFVRPDRFRYEFRDTFMQSPERRHIVWSQGQEVQTWTSLESKAKEAESLGLALAGAAGVSGGSAHMIPSLILPELGGRRLTDLTDLRRVEDAIIGKVEYFRIQGKYGDSPTTVWIDKTSFLVRKIDMTNTINDFRTEVSMAYEPVVNGKVTEEMLAFNPPQAAARD
jgi:outer membrane lipoprotein-sorting protein